MLLAPSVRQQGKVWTGRINRNELRRLRELNSLGARYFKGGKAKGARLTYKEYFLEYWSGDNYRRWKVTPSDYLRDYHYWTEISANEYFCLGKFKDHPRFNPDAQFESTDIRSNGLTYWLDRHYSDIDAFMRAFEYKYPYEAEAARLRDGRFVAGWHDWDTFHNPVNILHPDALSNPFTSETEFIVKANEKPKL